MAIRRSIFLGVLTASLIGNAFFVPAYFHAQHALRPGSVANELGGVRDAQIELSRYHRTHDHAQLGKATMWLMWVSGILNAYSLRSHDSLASEMSITLGNLAGALNLGQHVATATELIGIISAKLPMSGPRLAQERASQGALDDSLANVLRAMKTSGWSPLP